MLLGAPVSQPLSLRARALRDLARREFSRAELRARLLPHAESAEALDALLDELEARRLLSDLRFAEALVHRKAARYGTARIQQELRSHLVSPDAVEASVAQLRSSELERGRALWRKRFGEVATTPQDRLRQMRYLAARGFSADTVRRLVKGVAEDDSV